MSDVKPREFTIADPCIDQTVGPVRQQIVGMILDSEMPGDM